VIKTVLVDGNAQGKLTQYTFEQVTAPHTIEAQFEESGSYEWIVIVPGATKWMDTGISVSTGDIITFAVHGNVVYNRRGNSCGPEGTSWTDTRDKEDPPRQKPHGGLIGKIGENVSNVGEEGSKAGEEGSNVGEEGSPFFIGTSETMTAAQNGELLLGVNDFWYQGNTGEFTVTVTVSRANI
jgi:hypothetical protein